MQTPAPPAEIDCSTILSNSVNDVPRGPPAIRTGIGTAEHTWAKDSASPVHGTLTTSQPSSHATLAAWAIPPVLSSSETIRFAPRGYTIPRTGIPRAIASPVKAPISTIISGSNSSPRLI